MKTIEPIQIWSNGQNKTASKLSAKIVSDDLSISCIFHWNLYEQPVNSEVPTGTSYSSLSEGSLYMDGEDYQNWDGSNDGAYIFVASKINVTLIPDTTTTTTTQVS